jgi:hypothetical protein
MGCMVFIANTSSQSIFMVGFDTRNHMDRSHSGARGHMDQVAGMDWDIDWRIDWRIDWDMDTVGNCI